MMESVPQNIILLFKDEQVSQGDIGLREHLKTTKVLIEQSLLITINKIPLFEKSSL